MNDMIQVIISVTKKESCSYRFMREYFLCRFWSDSIYGKWYHGGYYDEVTNQLSNGI